MVKKMSQENVRVYPAILLKPEDNYDAVFDRLHAEGWSVNSSEYMQANTLEEAVMLQAESFPCLEFQPIQLPNPTDRFKWISAGKWVAFHRTPRPKPSLTPQETEHENLAVMDNLIERLKPTKPAEAQPTVPCAVYVEGGTDPANSHEPQYFVTLLPKGMTFPEDFFIGRGVMDTPQLEEYLKSQEDYYDEVESQGMMDDEYREEMVKKLPSPFNKLEAYVKLTWKYPEDVKFNEAGQIIWNIYQKTYTRQELEAQTVDELKTIAEIKGASTGGNKPEIIQSILYKQPQLEKIYFIDRDVAAKLMQKGQWWTATPSPEVPVKPPEFNVGNYVLVVGNEVGKVLEVKPSSITKEPSYEYFLEYPDGHKQWTHISAIKGIAKPPAPKMELFGSKRLDAFF